MRKCIYCIKSQDLTKSHIIPECLGSQLRLKYFVCEECNSKIGRAIEAKICKDFEFYRFIAQIKTKGKYATTRVELNVLGNDIEVEFRSGGVPKFIPPIIVDEGPPRKFFQVAESKKKLEKYIKNFAKMGIHFDESKMEIEDVKATFTVELANIDSVDYLRLATKIAFERLCLIGPTRVFNEEYNPIREFILNGIQPKNQVAFLFYEENIVNNVLPIPFPYHGILTFGFGKWIASIVTIFGLFYYLVLMNRNAYLLRNWVDYIYIDPKTGKMRVPLLKTFYSLPKLISSINRSQRDRHVLSKSKTLARNRFDDFLRQIKIMEE